MKLMLWKWFSITIVPRPDLFLVNETFATTVIRAVYVACAKDYECWFLSRSVDFDNRIDHMFWDGKM